jgi:ribosomal protein S18 acetylase RimI-like enzyme
MKTAPYLLPTTIRTAVADDASGIARTLLESGEHHASLDPERYSVPPGEEILARYRDGRQHSPDAGAVCITLVAERDGNIVGFVDARLDRSPDPMHRDILYCHISEIAVDSRYRSQGIGRSLLNAGEDWGRRMGAEFASLEVHIANTRASSLYHRMGYSAASITGIKRLGEADIDS